MLNNAKALIVILGIAWVMFALAKPFFLRFTAPEDYSRRRAVWFLLTIAAFLSPSFWLYVLFAMPLIAWAAHKDSTPLALYLLLFFVISPVSVSIPTLVIQQLFDLTNMRMLGFAILVPAVWARLAARRHGEPLRLNRIDIAFLLYGALQLTLLFPYETVTNTMRRAFLFLLDGYLVYFAFSRLLRERRQVADAMGALCLAALIAAPIGIFESLRGWLLYVGVPLVWGRPVEGYLFRDYALRAQASMGHSLTLGYVIAMAIGLWMYLKYWQASKLRNVAFVLVMSVALFVTYARGPWIAAVLVVVFAAVLGSRNVVQIVKMLLPPVAAVALVIVSPFGARFIALMPFIGTTGQDTIEQRRRLAETSWRLIQENPLFGNPFVLLQMEDLRLGQNGIIDLVNAYAQVALFYGLIGLALFVAVYIGALVKSFATLKLSRAAGDMDMVWMGSSLIACMVASLFLMAAAGHLWLEWALAGLLVSYARLQPIESSAEVSPSVEAYVRPTYQRPGLRLRP
jgi:O-antigen ligase